MLSATQNGRPRYRARQTTRGLRDTATAQALQALSPISISTSSPRLSRRAVTAETDAFAATTISSDNLFILFVALHETVADPDARLWLGRQTPCQREPSAPAFRRLTP